MMQLPQEITSLIAHFSPAARAADPRWYRAARSVQAAWRSYVERNPPSSRCLCNYAQRSYWAQENGTDVCPSCATVWGEFLFGACERCGEEDAQLAEVEPWTCDACRLEYMIEAFEDGAVPFVPMSP